LIDETVLKLQQPRPSRPLPLRIVLRGARPVVTPLPSDRAPRRLGSRPIGALAACRPLALGAGEDARNPVNK
jgi:hypothetical protein